MRLNLPTVKSLRTDQLSGAKTVNLARRPAQSYGAAWSQASGRFNYGNAVDQCCVSTGITSIVTESRLRNQPSESGLPATSVHDLVRPILCKHLLNRIASKINPSSPGTVLTSVAMWWPATTIAWIWWPADAASCPYANGVTTPTNFNLKISAVDVSTTVN